MKNHLSNSELSELDKNLNNIDSQIAISLSYVKKIQGIGFDDISKRFTNISPITIQRYFQQSYKSKRSLHTLAAFSWFFMTPMAGFYSNMKARENWRGMTEKSARSLLCIGNINKKNFEIITDLLANSMSNKDRIDYIAFKESILTGDDDLGFPERLDLDAFAIDYYQSIAVIFRRIRLEENLNYKEMARRLNVTEKEYMKIENRQAFDLHISIGFRAKLAFKLNEHSTFSSEMTTYPKFHKLRLMQSYRENLLIRGFSKLDANKQNTMSELIFNISKL